MRFSGIAGSLEGEYKDLLKLGDPAKIMQSKSPDFLKIAALEKIKEIRNSGSQPPPQGTVAQRVVQESMGQGAQMPPQGMPPQGMPPHVNDMGVASLPGEAPPRPPAMEQGLASLPADMNFADGGVVSFSRGGYEDPVDEYERRKKFYQDTGEYYPDPSIFEDIHALSGLSKLQPEKHYSDKSPVARALREPELRPTEMRAMLGVPVEQKPSTPEEDYGFSMEETPEPSEFGAGLGIREAIAGGGPSPLPPMGEYPKAPQMEKPEKWDFGEYKKRQGEMDEEYGVDPAFFQKQKDALKEELAGREKEFTSDKWMALAQAGARMMQTPGSFGRALGAGAETGLGALEYATKEFRADKQALNDMQRQLAAAEQAEARGNSKEAQRMRDSVEAQYRNAVNEQTKIDAEYAMNKFTREEERAMTEYEVKNTWDMARFNADMKYRIAMATSTAEGYKANLDLMKFIAGTMKDANLTPDGLADIQISSMEQADTAAKLDPKYEDMKPADQEIYKARLAKEIAAGQIADIQRVTREQTKDIFRATGLFAPERQ